MGIVTVKLPDIGEGIAEAELTGLHVKLGDLIAEDDPIADVMTDKATVEVPSAHAGKVVWIAGQVGDILAVGADLIHIEIEGDGDDLTIPGSDAKSSHPGRSHVPDTVVAANAETVTAAPTTDAPSHRIDIAPPSSRRTPAGTRPLAAPSLRQRARDAGVDLRQVAGSGPAGRILHRDLDAFLSGMALATMPANAADRIETVRLTGLRRRIAERMEAAKSRAPHITIVEEVDVTALEDLRTKLNDDATKPRLTILPFLMRAMVRAVADQPAMNAHFDDVENLLHLHSAVHIGIATQTANGLVVPVIRHCETRGLRASASELARLSEAARDNSATREDLGGSTITISSLGPLGALATTPILNRPEVAIVGVNRIATRPFWDGQAFVPRRMMNLSSSFDHRVIDGWDAAVFVQRLKALLETPALMFVED